MNKSHIRRNYKYRETRYRKIFFRAYLQNHLYVQQRPSSARERSTHTTKKTLLLFTQQTIQQNQQARPALPWRDTGVGKRMSRKEAGAEGAKKREEEQEGRRKGRSNEKEERPCVRHADELKDQARSSVGLGRCGGAAVKRCSRQAHLVLKWVVRNLQEATSENFHFPCLNTKSVAALFPFFGCRRRYRRPSLVGRRSCCNFPARAVGVHFPHYFRTKNLRFSSSSCAWTSRTTFVLKSYVRLSLAKPARLRSPPADQGGIKLATCAVREQAREPRDNLRGPVRTAKVAKTREFLHFDADPRRGSRRHR